MVDFKLIYNLCSRFDVPRDYLLHTSGQIFPWNMKNVTNWISRLQFLAKIGLFLVDFSTKWADLFFKWVDNSFSQISMFLLKICSSFSNLKVAGQLGQVNWPKIALGGTRPSWSLTYSLIFPKSSAPNPTNFPTKTNPNYSVAYLMFILMLQLKTKICKLFISIWS